MSTSTTTVTWVTPAAEKPPGQPDINYAPDYDKWQQRAARRLAEGNLPTKVPDGFPTELTGPTVWEGRTLAETYDWTYILNADQLTEIDQAVAHFKCEQPALHQQSVLERDLTMSSPRSFIRSHQRRDIPTANPAF
jgi:hypothetical protein